MVLGLHCMLEDICIASFQTHPFQMIQDKEVLMKRKKHCSIQENIDRTIAKF